MSIKIKDILAESKILIENAPSDLDINLIDAQIILAEHLGMNRMNLLVSSDLEIDETKYKEFKKLFKRRLEGEPTQYIIAKACFMGFDFYVDKNVLIPRPETEYMLEYIMNNVYKRGDKYIDMCTGSGCIGISLALLSEKSSKKKGILVDISKKALEVARKNSIINGVFEQVDFLESDLFEKLAQSEFINDIPSKKVDFILSNPPYIKEKDMKNLSKELSSEPSLALLAGETGIEFYEKIIPESRLFLRNKGAIVFEIGFDEAKEVEKLLLENSFKEIEIIKDLNGLDRIVKGIYYV